MHIVAQLSNGSQCVKNQMCSVMQSICGVSPERVVEVYILVKVPCECITGNIARGRGREPIKHEAQPSALFARDHAPSAIFSVMHERERYFNWFIVAEFLASAAINDSKWALRSKLPITMLGRSRGKTGEPL